MKDEMDARWAAYFYPNTEVLKNKFDITDKKALRETEIEGSFNRLVELIDNPIVGKFDAFHLRQIHEYLFQDIYYFAGQYRNVNMERNHHGFTDYEMIDKSVNEELRLMAIEEKNIYSKYDFACHLARYYAELLNIHPFREGNGRTIREFIREYANEKSKNYAFGPLEFSWSLINKDDINENIQYSIAFRSIIELAFLKALTPISQENAWKR